MHAILGFTSGGSLHASLRPARWVRDDDKQCHRYEDETRKKSPLKLVLAKFLDLALLARSALATRTH